MLLLAISLLLISQCFAHGVGRHGSHSLHLLDDKDVTSVRDSNHPDSVHEKDWTIPDVKFIYNYEQMRKDQPTHIEQREDNLGNYINTNALTSTTTTTTTPAPIMQNDDNTPEIHRMFDTSITVLESPHHRHHHNHHHHHSKQPNHTETATLSLSEKQEDHLNLGSHFPSHWNNQAAYPAIMPPPPTLPKWGDLNELLKQHPYPQHMAHLSKPHHITGHKLRNELTTTATPQNSERPKKHKHSAHHIPSLPNWNDFTTTTVKEVLETKTVPSRGHVRNRPQHIHRGNHKFNWNEVTQAPMPLFSRTTLAPPPPVPTLSPWYDGFGK